MEVHVFPVDLTATQAGCFKNSVGNVTRLIEWMHDWLNDWHGNEYIFRWISFLQMSKKFLFCFYFEYFLRFDWKASLCFTWKYRAGCRFTLKDIIECITRSYIWKTKLQKYSEKDIWSFSSLQTFQDIFLSGHCASKDIRLALLLILYPYSFSRTFQPHSQRDFPISRKRLTLLYVVLSFG